MRVLKKNFWKSLLYKQNKWHKHGVFIHTLKVTYHLIKNKDYDLVLAGLLHDIGKPFSAHQKLEDVATNELSFTNHEEMSWYLIKDWKISDYTKNIVRYHYILRDLELTKKKGNYARFNRLSKKYERFSLEFKADLKRFQIADDLGKK